MSRFDVKREFAMWMVEKLSQGIRCEDHSDDPVGGASCCNCAALSRELEKVEARFFKRAYDMPMQAYIESLKSDAKAGR